MNKEQADFMIQVLDTVLTGRTLVSVAVRGDRGLDVDVRRNMFYKNSYRVDYQDGSCAVAVSDSYGVMTGAEEWHIDPDKRQIIANTVSGSGHNLYFSWMVDEDDKDGELWYAMKDMQKAYWEIQR